MCRLLLHLVAAAIFASGLVPLAGCGTTRSSDTSRTATEQLLISDAIDRAVQTVNIQPLAGQTVFLDDSRLDSVDKNYLVSTMRQHLLAHGCQLRDKRDEADFVVEVRAGAVGTDRNDLLFGIPSMSVPQIVPLQPLPAAIPEVPVAKRRHQRGIVKIAVFAYHRESGTPVWQSGLAREESSSNDVWILGAGPFQRGTIYQGTEFAGKALGGDDSKDDPTPTRLPPVDLTREGTFNSPQWLVQQSKSPAADQEVVQAGHEEPSAVVAGEELPAAPVAATAPPAPADGAAPQTAHEKPPRASVYSTTNQANLPQPRFQSR